MPFADRSFRSLTLLSAIGLAACGGNVTDPSPSGEVGRGNAAAPSPNAPALTPDAPAVVSTPDAPGPAAAYPIPVGTGATALARDGQYLYFAWTEQRTTEVVARTRLSGGPVERIATHAVPYDVPKSLAVTATHVLFRSDRSLFAFAKSASSLVTLTTPISADPVPASVTRVVSELDGKRGFYVAGPDVFAVDGASAAWAPVLDGLTPNERRSVSALAAGDGAVFAVTTGIDYNATPMEWATVSRLDADGATVSRVKLDGRGGAAAASVAQGKLVVAWGDRIDVLDAKTLGAPSTTPLNGSPEVVAITATSRGLFFIQRQAPDPYGKLDGLMLTGAANALAASAPSMLSDGGAPRLGAELVADDAHVYWVRRDPARPNMDAPGVIERVAK